MSASWVVLECPGRRGGILCVNASVRELIARAEARTNEIRALVAEEAAREAAARAAQIEKESEMEDLNAEQRRTKAMCGHCRHWQRMAEGLRSARPVGVCRRERADMPAKRDCDTCRHWADAKGGEVAWAGVRCGKGATRRPSEAS